MFSKVAHIASGRTHAEPRAKPEWARTSLIITQRYEVRCVKDAPCAATRHGCDNFVSSERLFQVGDQILHVLDAHREAHQAVVDAQCRALVGRNRGVRHQRRMLDQAFDASQAFGQRKDLAAFEETPGTRLAAGEHGRDHAAEAVHLALRQRVLRMLGRPG